jgi:hypothetical protein
MFKIQIIDPETGEWVDLYIGFQTEQDALDYVFGMRMLIGNAGKQYQVVPE